MPESDVTAPRPWDDPAFRHKCVEAAAVALLCLAVNVMFVRGVTWWPFAWFGLGVGVWASYKEAWQRAVKRARKRAEHAVAEEPGPPVAEATQLEEARTLRTAVEELAARLTPDERALLGDVVVPLESLERRVASLVAQAREVDGQLGLHDEEELRAEVEAGRARVGSLPDGLQREDEQAALDVLERQHATLERVLESRARIDARLRTAVGMMKALHLDLVELRSSDLSGDSAGLRRLGEQVREVSRGVDALATAVDDVFREDLASLRTYRVASDESAAGREGVPRRGRRRSRT